MSHETFDELLSTLIPVGRERVEEDQNEFLPFAAALLPDHQIKYVGPETEQTFPSPPDALEFLHAGLRNLAEDGTIRASAVVSPVRVQLPDEPEESDAIRFHLEHGDGVAANVYLPFAVDGMSGEVAWGDPFEVDGELNIFQPA